MKRSSLGPSLAITLAALSGCAGFDLAGLLSPAPKAAASPTPSAAPSAAPSAQASPTAEPSTGGSPTPSPTPVPTTTPDPTPVAGNPSDFVEAAGAAKLFVMNGLSKTLDRIDLATGLVSKGAYSTGQYPNQIRAVGSTGYLVNSGDATLVKLNLLNTVAQMAVLNLPVGSNPMTVTPIGGGKGLVVNLIAKTAVFVNLDTMATGQTINLPQGQPGGGVALANGKAYIAAVTADYSNYPAISFSFSGVHVLDLTTREVVRTINLVKEANPYEVSRDPDGYIQVGTDTGVVTVNPMVDKIVRSIDFGTKVGALGYLGAEKAYGAAGGNGLVSFNPRTGQILRGADNKIVAGDTSVGHFRIRGSAAYVPNFANDTVTVVDLVTETASGSAFQVGDGPQEVAFVIE